MNKIVFIASLSHSGSTLLDLLIGSNENTISLGEVYTSVTKFEKPQKVCTCGKEVENCELWHPIYQTHKETTDKISITDSYTSVIKRVNQIYDKNTMIVDSSKTLRALEILKDIKDVELYVLFLLKDVRSFVFSQKKRKVKDLRKKAKAGWRRIFIYSTLYNIHRWYTGNKRIKNFLRENKINHFQLGYEELCFKPEKILKQISKFLKIEFEDKMLYPKNSLSHIIRGNLMRFNKDKTQAIKYDYKWMIQTDNYINEMAYSTVLKWNKQNVYRNSK